MKKYTLFITIILTALIALNGCSITIVDKETDIYDESKEAFAQTVLHVSDSHDFVIQAYEGEITSPDGTVLATYEYSYPVFECNEGDDEEYIETINEMFKDNALDLASGAENGYDYLVEEYEASKNYEYQFRPYVYSYSFAINTDAKGILSVTEIWYFYTGGAHGGTVKESHNYDLVNGKKLSLSDLLYGTDEEITEAFTKEFLKIKDAFFDDPSVVVPEELPNAQYCVDSEGVTAYFQEYQVGPYSSGFVSATISDKEMLKYDFS